MSSQIIIEPQKIFNRKELVEIWNYRELLYFFTWRDLKVRYKQTAIGIIWVIFQPLISMIIFTAFFARLVGPLPGNVPYPIFVYVGLIFWQLFSSSLTDISECLINNKGIVTKVYFPRLSLPISAILTRLIDTLIASLLLIVLMLYYHATPTWLSLIILPIAYLLAMMATLGLGLILSALNTKYRDVRYVLPFFIQMLLFVTPVIYPARLVGDYTKILILNPLTGIIKAARSVLLNDLPINWTQLGISALLSLVLLIVGYVYFRKTEQLSADII